MTIYLATPTSVLTYDKTATKGVYILETYHEIKNKESIPWLDPNYFMLDSGAYTFMRGNAKNIDKIDWEQYIFEYAKFIKKHKVKLFFELDIDSIIGYDNVLRLTEKLNKLVGYKCIPVWHKSRGVDAWIESTKKHDYVSLSASGNNNSSEWTRKPNIENVLFKMNKIAQKNGAKVHALGFTKFDILGKVMFTSCDSTSWTYGLRSGQIQKFRNGKIVKIPKSEGTRLIAKNVIPHDYAEWVKLQKYYLTK